jgi:hypothetical protein
VTDEARTAPDIDPRAERLTSHAVAEVRRFRYLPFFVESAVLLDLSPGGFKLEFTGESEAHAGIRYWLHIPLKPLGIDQPKSFICRAECRWFDEVRFRMGGVFVSLSEEQKQILERILRSLQDKFQSSNG